MLTKCSNERHMCCGFADNYPNSGVMMFRKCFFADWAFVAQPLAHQQTELFLCLALFQTIILLGQHCLRSSREQPIEIVPRLLSCFFRRYAAQLGYGLCGIHHEGRLIALSPMGDGRKKR